MKIAYNPVAAAAVITATTAANDDILFDLKAKKIWAKGLRMGADWADITNRPTSLPANGGNADTVDNLHASDFVRAYGTSNDNIDSDWGQSFKTFDPIPSGTPPEQCPNISLLSIGNKFNRRKQLAFPYYNDNIYYRRHIDNGFTNWVKLLHSGNSYIQDGKGIINNNTITKVDTATNADKLDNWHKDNIQWTGYISSNTANLQSYWFKMYDVTITSKQSNDVTITFLVSEGYGGNFSIFHLKIRQGGTNGSGAYNLNVTLRELVGNLKYKIVAYYNNKTGNVQLWGDVGNQWGVLNYTILKKTERVATDFTTLGTLTAKYFDTVQAQPTTDYIKVTMSRVGQVQYAESSSSSTQTTKLQTARSLWGNSFDGTKDISGSITFPAIGDTATSNKISWNGSSDGADIYYQTTARDQGNLVLNVKDGTNAYIQLALNGTFKSHFDVANSYWTGRSALADKWTTARTFTIGNTAKNVDGSGNVSWSLSEIGVRDTWRTVQVNSTSIGNNTLNLCGSTYIGLTNVDGKVTFSLVGSGTTANQAILSNGTANGWTLKTLNIANWDAAYNLRHSHANKSVLDGITSGSVSNWNTAYTFVHTITGTDTDNVINKWDEIVNFLAGITEDNKLNTLLNSKLSVYKLADKTNIGAIKNNGIYYSTSDASSGTLTNSPFSNGFALINMTSYDGGDDLGRSRLAFNAFGEIKVSDDRSQSNTTETWYNVLTSKNSGINGSTIKLNGSSITVYSSGTADGRYVKKSGDTMTGVLTIDTTNFGALTIKRNDDTNGASIQFRGKSSVYGYIGLNNSTKDKQFLRYSSDSSKTYTILDTSSTYISSGKGVINGTTITQVDNATNATNSTNARKLVNWYSSRPTSLNAQFGDGSLRIFYATSSTTEGKPAEDSHILHLAWDNTGGWDAQLAVHTSSGKVSTRAQSSGTWQPWKTLAFTTDIPSSLKNPHSLTLKANGTTLATYDGSSAKEANFTYANVGAASASHTHSYYAVNENYGGFKKAERLPISGFYQSYISDKEESGGNAPWKSWMHLINCQHSNTGNNYALQIAASFFDNNIFKIRVTNGNVDNAWRDIIHSGNIGQQSVKYATSAGSATSATKVIVSQHTTNDINYPLVWSNQPNTSNVTENQLYKSWQDLYYNPKNKRLFVGGSVSTAYINATNTVTSKGFVHTSVTKNANQYVLTADGGYTFLNQASNELAHEFSVNITVTSEWTDIEDFYGGNQSFLTQPGTYIVQVYYTTNSANSMYEGYFSGIMSWYTGKTNSNNADEIVLHRVGHAYANTIYLRTRESLSSEANPYTKLQISANSDLKQHTYKFKFKRIC